MGATTKATIKGTTTNMVEVMGEDMEVRIMETVIHIVIAIIRQGLLDSLISCFQQLGHRITDQTITTTTTIRTIEATRKSPFDAKH